MTSIPDDVGDIHLIGIGGIGMSGIAEVLHALGCRVRGSDAVDGDNVKRLRDKGIRVVVGHRDENLDGASAAVYSSAVSADNVEILAARRRRIPLLPRAAMLAELMRFKRSVAVGGTHGKTTVTSLVAALLESGGLDPTVVNGGVVNDYNSNVRIGNGDWMVVESDESDGSFKRLRPDVAVITNIDPEHMERYGSMDAVRRAYERFVEAIPFYGAAAICVDHDEARRLAERVDDRRVIRYGRRDDADVRLVDESPDGDGSRFGARLRLNGEEREIADLRLPMPGRHNALNAIAAVAVAARLGVADDDVRRGLAKFGGVKRRFSKVGVFNGAVVYDDYAHHPAEIEATLRTARDLAEGRVVAVAQPHRYSRLRDLETWFAECFADADVLVVAPVYAAGESPIEGVDHVRLAERVAERMRETQDAVLKPDRVFVLDDIDALGSLLSSRISPSRGDLIACMGAGSIGAHARRLTERES